MIHHERDVREEQQCIYVARTSNNRVIAAMISLVVCCHSVKLCAHAARAFRLQQQTIPNCEMQATQDRSVINTSINKLPFEPHLPGHNFTELRMNVNKRLNPDIYEVMELNNGLRRQNC